MWIGRIYSAKFMLYKNFEIKWSENLTGTENFDNTKMGFKTTA
jgi:hypothetical protein